MVQNDGSADMVKQGKRIENLLTSALSLAQGFLKSGESQTNANVSLVPTKLSFSASHREQILLQDRACAKEYMSLPAAEYSVLSSRYVSRVEQSGRDDHFIITIPIGKVGGVVSEDTSPRFVDMCAVSDVMVSPQPELGSVVMTSGPILFAPQPSLSDTLAGNKGEEANFTAPVDDLTALRSILPPWLVEYEDKRDGDKRDGDKRDGDKRDGDKRLTSAIQAGFEVILAWPTNEDADRPGGFLRSLLNREERDRGDGVGVGAPYVSAPEPGTEAALDLPEQIGQLSPNGSTLKVEARLRVWVDLNLPLRRDISRAVSFAPIRILLEQAGSLTVKAVASGVAPSLVALLRRDYENRRNS